MLIEFTWLIPGLPIFTSIFIAVLLLSFSKTINRLTKPVSYLIIISATISEIINFIFFDRHISGSNLLLGSNFELIVDTPALVSSILLGFLVLLIMIFSLNKLERRNGYVRYFIFLGFLSGLVYLFSFSGVLFHNSYDYLVSSLDKIGISFF